MGATAVQIPGAPVVPTPSHFSEGDMIRGELCREEGVQPAPRGLLGLHVMAVCDPGKQPVVGGEKSPAAARTSEREPGVQHSYNLHLCGNL